jgi:glyoxylase-like metal-dependent hydrolase (beta-lactamase superfamily II)
VRLWMKMLVLLWVGTNSAWAENVNFQPVTGSVYAFIGEIDDRTRENLGLNANIGLVVTSSGAVLIDSGAGPVSAEALEAGVRAVTDQKIVAVINTGSQDHRWLGNQYFAERGATIYALQRTVNTQKAMLDSILRRIQGVDPIFKEQKPLHAPTPFVEDQAAIVIGDVRFELKYFDDAHFPGDIVVWLPEQEVLFTGDHVYLDRLLGVHPHTHAGKWLKAFDQLIQIPARYVVPGHGAVADRAKAQAESGDYLAQLVAGVRKAVEDMEPMESVLSGYDWSPWQHLKHFDNWHARTVSNTHQRFEQQGM